ncbi:tRNA guanosine(34) transglycosylase Tgt [Magnetospira sp. QH-2]|uniref:tRNA guanosine(34) transglycosylase Tgt n=1 Tax=Magnetospira sp. (strain QH-2) TaxID=1288970 RepID=UPI0003E80D7C|nr:tRNA guanosine(34) transglycosylase Tgt [Magnetospira sp. QH-2]CCQ75262.1 tRNA-guanine transglycosylase (queuine/archaeosine tRNA-ribosyltransferase) [Magnetospira sp. QH-2]
MTIGFEILATDGAARRGRLTSAHGSAETPAFMPVGTAGTVKAMYPEQVAETGAEIVLGNTYHLMLRPSAERVARLGGLHKFMNWNQTILTDSGGFQVMSLSDLRKLTEDGVTFRSHVDGAYHHLTPERSVEIQHLLDSNITMVLDECPKFGTDKDQIAKSLHLTSRWALRSRHAFQQRPGYGLFGIVQGGVHADLRAESAADLVNIGFDGYAVGGLAVGEDQETTLSVLDFTVPLLPVDRPHYLMGVGTPADIVEAVRRGIDMFDCVMPTRSGRTGQAFTRRGPLNLRNARHKDDPRPIEEGCSCPACRQYSRAYLHHLVRAKEMLGPMLLTRHNLQHYQDLMKDLRAAIEAGTLDAFAAHFHAVQASGDIEPMSSDVFQVDVQNGHQ